MTAGSPLPPFTEQTERQKVQAAEDARNPCDPCQVALAYTQDSAWRNRGTFVTGRDQIVAFLIQKWERKLEIRFDDVKSAPPHRRQTVQVP